MFCKYCKSDKPESEMHSSARCQDCMRAKWRQANDKRKASGKVQAQPVFSKKTPWGYHVIPKEAHPAVVLNTQYLTRRFV